MQTLGIPSKKTGFATVAPWLAGGSAAFAIRMGLSIAGSDATRADTIAMFAFIGISLGCLAIPPCARIVAASDSPKREKTVALLVLAALTAILSGFAFFAYLHGVRG